MLFLIVLNYTVLPRQGTSRFFQLGINPILFLFITQGFSDLSSQVSLDLNFMLDKEHKVFDI